VVESVPTFFFPGRLDPVLDGGVRDEDAVITPQVPTGVLVGESVFTHQANSQILDATCVEALGQSQFGHVHSEATATVCAAMSGEGNEQVDGPSGVSVAQIV
jgi:hypothetical protein